MLRPMKYRDLEWVRKERNNPECMKWFRQSLPLTQAQQLEWFDTTDMVSFIVLDENSKVGVVALSHIDHIARKCEFSIMISPERRNQGFGKKALIELLDYAFGSLNMKQVYSDVFEDNPALEMYKKMGFFEVGRLPNWYFKNGRYVSSVIITLPLDEYNRLKSTISKEDCSAPDFVRALDFKV